MGGGDAAALLGEGECGGVGEVFEAHASVVVEAPSEDDAGGGLADGEWLRVDGDFAGAGGGVECDECPGAAFGAGSWPGSAADAGDECAGVF